MSILRPNDCCFCFSLSTGSKIIAAFTVLTGITSLYNGFSAIGVEEKYVYIIDIIIGFVSLLIGAMLFYGAVAKRAGFVYPWVFINIVRIILGLIISILTAIYGHFWVAVSFFIIAYLLNIYFTLVVYSFYQELSGGGGSNV